MGNSNYSKGFEIGSEFSGADFGDPRLAKRLQKIAASLANNPKESFPQALGHGAGAEGGYRFLRNDRVDFQKITEPHFRETRLRAEAKDEVFVLHDTTEFKFSSGQRREGLGWSRHSKSSAQGFFGHFSFAVSGGKKPRPLGVVAVEPSVRKGKKKGYQSPLKRKQDPTRKSLRWMRGVESANEVLGEKVNAIHVMDREADFFELLSEMLDLKCRYVIRVCRDRLLEDSEGLYETLEGVQVKLKRQVAISSRKRSPLPSSRKIHPPRQKRLAKLHVRATKVVLKRTHHNDSSLNGLIPVNVIHVFEPNPPKGETPVDWKLLTTEAIDTKKEVEKVVDTYRARWLIEEYFKALKTGCEFEKRQLESLTTILNALGILIPIAWRLLLVRNTVREEPTAPAKTVLTGTQIDVLKYFCPKKLPEQLTVTDALYGIAALGGHLTQNGPPGWIVLGRGLTKLLTLEQGWSAAKS